MQGFTARPDKATTRGGILFQLFRVGPVRMNSNKHAHGVRVAKTMDGIKKAVAAGGTVMPKAK
jgi:hypothetical protein